MANYLEDLKKKGQQAANVVQNVASDIQQGVNTAKQQAPGVIEQAKDTMHNVMNGVNSTINTGRQVLGRVNSGVKEAIDFGRDLYGAGKAGYEGAVQGVKNYYSDDTQSPQTDWVAEYDKAMQGSATPTPTTPTTQNPDGSVTVTQPNGQPINTSPAVQAALGAGAGQWQAELDDIMNQIMNRDNFSYDMNGDAMYQQYADIYQNQAKRGMENAMAQAAALTGGYGSSYGQMVGQQAYAQQMQDLNEIGMNLYDRAYDQYLNEGNQLAQQYAMIAEREQQAYNREIDERNFEYQKYLDELEQSNYEKEFAYQQGRDDVSDKQWANSFDYQQSQDKQAQQNYENEFAYQREQDAQAQSNWQAELDRYLANDAQAQQNYENELAYQQDRDAIADERYNDEWAASEEQRVSDNKYRDDALAEDQRQFNESMNWQAEEWDKMYGENGFYTKQNAQDQANWETQWKASEEQRGIENNRYDDALKAQEEANNPNTTYEGEGILNGQSVPKQLAGVPGLTTTNPALFDDNGHFKQAAVVSGTTSTGDLLGAGENDTLTVGEGTMTYNIGGKEVTLKTGTSPYTNTVNPDAQNGVMENGYQPDNIGGKKVTEGNTEALINGQWVPTYTTPDGKSWYYDAANNSYEEIPDNEEEKTEETPKTNDNPDGGYKIGTGGGGGSKKPVYIAHD